MQARLDKALELGADGVINGKEQNAVQAVLDLTDGFGCDLVIETAGTEFTTRQAIEMVHKGATIVLVGYSKSGEMTLPVSLALDKEPSRPCSATATSTPWPSTRSPRAKSTSKAS